VISALASQVLYHLCAHTFTHFEHFLKLRAQSQMSIMREEVFSSPKSPLQPKTQTKTPSNVGFLLKKLPFDGYEGPFREKIHFGLGNQSPKYQRSCWGPMPEFPGHFLPTL